MNRKRINIEIIGSRKLRSTQSMAGLLEKILDKKNMKKAYKTAPIERGVDGMEIEELDGYIRKNWDSIIEQLRERSYKSQPVGRGEIPKPDGNKRKFGIPAIMNRVLRRS